MSSPFEGKAYAPDLDRHVKRLFIFGYGFSGRALARRLDGAWELAATSRDAGVREVMTQVGLQALDPAEPTALAAALSDADAVLIAAPPGEQGCPGLAALAPLWPHGHGPWIGYLSTTGVYGDRAGGWVREESPTAPASPEARRRVEAEDGWRRLADACGAPLCLFRLPGIYGPGRSSLDRVREGGARRWIKPGHVFSRIHVDDLADALALALDQPARTGVYAICDDEPAEPTKVTAYAYRLLGLEPSPEEAFDPAGLTPATRRFWAESKRVSNARAKAALGWRPASPSYREGLNAVLAAEARRRNARDGRCGSMNGERPQA